MFDSWSISVLSTSNSMLGDSETCIKKMSRCTVRWFRGWFIARFLLCDFGASLLDISPTAAGECRSGVGDKQYGAPENDGELWLLRLYYDCFRSCDLIFDLLETFQKQQKLQKSNIKSHVSGKESQVLKIGLQKPDIQNSR